MEKGFGLDEIFGVDKSFGFDEIFGPDEVLGPVTTFGTGGDGFFNFGACGVAALWVKEGGCDNVGEGNCA